MAVPIDPTRLRLTSADGSQGVLLGYRCYHCGAYSFGHTVFCQACTSASLEPVELSPRGTLYSYTVVHIPPPGWPGPVPYLLGQVELPEGPHVLAEVVGCSQEELRIGAQVELVLGPVTVEGQQEERMVYRWRLVRPEGIIYDPAYAGHAFDPTLPDAKEER